MDGYFYMFRYVMALNFFALGGPDWFLDHKFLSVENVCRWNTANGGVLCYQYEGAVVPVELILSSNNLRGEIPVENGKLYTLRGLNFGVNLLTGSIPSEFCSLFDLRYLVLNHNALSGSIPACVGLLSDLDELVLSDNALDGSLPPELGNLQRLESFYIDDNKLEGDPAPVFNKLTNLTHLMANANQFKSDIDFAFLAGNTRMQWLDISHNRFTGRGMLPGHLFRSPMQVLDVSENQVSCDFPTTLVENTDLWFLSLSGNKISGPLNCLSALKGLRHLDVSNNLVIGSMEPIGLLEHLEILFLSENFAFTAGPVPASFANLGNLTELSLRNTQRNGPLPKLAPKLKFLDLSTNALQGTVPAAYGSQLNLTILLLNGNGGITGELPSSFQQLSNLRAVFTDGTSLDKQTMDVLCMLQDLHHVEGDVVLVADCDECSCRGCKCCSSGSCSDPPLDNVDVSWESDFQRQKFELLGYSDGLRKDHPTPSP
jgi:Leucine-rich repeat (LRR) protein